MSTPKSNLIDFRTLSDQFFREKKERALEFLSQHGIPVREVVALPAVENLPKFPTLLELVEESQRPEVPGPKTGVFLELLRGRPEVLLEDAQKNDEYDAETLQVLYALHSRRLALSDLDDEQLDLLNEATMRMLSRPEVNNPDVHKKPPQRPSRQIPSEPQAQSPFAEKEEAAPLGEDGLPAFWWLK